jgi:riboflavin biosynthesis pyrimidine reductase
MKPYVICHMCTSIDGRILSDRWRRWLPPRSSAQLFEKTASSFRISSWVVGTTTMREFAAGDRSLPRSHQRIARTDYLADRKASSHAIGTDAKGVLRFRQPDVDGDHVVLLLSERVGDDYLAHLRAAGVSYLFCGRNQVDARIALDKLARLLGIRRLMLEGGGTFNGVLLRAGLVDEISQVIVPIADGGTGIPSIFDIPGPAPAGAAAALRLIRRRTLPGGFQWFRYRVISRRRAT